MDSLLSKNTTSTVIQVLDNNVSLFHRVKKKVSSFYSMSVLNKHCYRFELLPWFVLLQLCIVAASYIVAGSYCYRGSYYCSFVLLPVRIIAVLYFCCFVYFCRFVLLLLCIVTAVCIVAALYRCRFVSDGIVSADARRI